MFFFLFAKWKFKHLSFIVIRFNSFAMRSTRALLHDFLSMQLHLKFNAEKTQKHFRVLLLLLSFGAFGDLNFLRRGRERENVRPISHALHSDIDNSLDVRLRRRYPNVNDDNVVSLRCHSDSTAHSCALKRSRASLSTHFLGMIGMPKHKSIRSIDSCFLVFVVVLVVV